MKETEIVKTICEYLSYKENQGKLMFWRQNTAPIWSGGKPHKMPKYSKNGIPDIIVIKDGFFIGLEVKKEKGGRQSDSQKEFERLSIQNGAEYYIVKSLDDLKEIGL